MDTAAKTPRLLRVCLILTLWAPVGVAGAQAPSRAAVAGNQASADCRVPTLPPNVIDPDALKYVGAFKVPADGHDLMDWAAATCALTYYPGGDAGGPDDGYPGSLFGSGHGAQNVVSEISIPRPVVSSGKDPRELNTAKTLQPFVKVSASTPGGPQRKGFGSWIRALGYLPRQGEQKSDKVYFSGWTSYMPDAWSHGCFGADLSNLNAAGMWPLRGQGRYVANTAFVRIPKAWADKHCRGMYLGMGGEVSGVREGCGMGPELIACAPWKQYVDGKPPKPGTPLDHVVLLKYGNWRGGGKVRDNQHNDGWYGAAWVTRGKASALIFIGSKDVGESYYGYVKNERGDKVFVNHGKQVDGNGKPIDRERFPYVARDRDTGAYYGVKKVEGGKGWKSDIPRACMLFYNPDDLAAVAGGRKQPGEPQPYARLDVSERMFIERHTLFGGAYDRENGILYCCEPRVIGRGDRRLARWDSRPVVHVWRIGQAP
jgi:hypothetical protein